MNNIKLTPDELYKELEKAFIEREIRRKAKEQRAQMNHEHKNRTEFRNCSYDHLLQTSIKGI